MGATPMSPTRSRPTRWITREKPKIDRIACPWLVSRFVDPAAEFIFVPADRVLAEAAARAAAAVAAQGKA